MYLNVPSSKRTLVTLVLLVSVLVTACGTSPTSQPKTYTIGVLIQTSSLEPLWVGFKSGLTKAGYVEGKTVTYIYDGPTNTIEALKPEAEKLKSQKLDLLVTIGTPPTQTAKEVFADTKVPILFAPVLNPVELGLAASYRNPGGNLTGIQSTDTVGKALEYLLLIAPGVKRVYAPNATQDSSSVQSLQSLADAAKAQGVEVVVANGSTTEELDAITQTIPENVDAVFMLRSGSLTAAGRLGKLIQAASVRRVPTVTSQIGPQISAGILLGYGPGYTEMGLQLSRMADKVLKGTDPGTLPIENAEAYLGINLQTAQAIGLEIPDSIVRQATQIVRLPSEQTGAATAAATADK
jgi:putative ABC transport system substrate-binding protein